VLTLANFEQRWPRHRANRRIVVFKDARLESSRTDGIFGAQSKMQRDPVTRAMASKLRIACVAVRLNPAVVSGSHLRQSHRYWGPLSLAGLPITLLYSANSEGEHIISLTSKLGGCNLKRNLSRATQGLVYIFGSSIVTLSSRVS